jgi:hypothetical protein
MLGGRWPQAAAQVYLEEAERRPVPQAPPAQLERGAPATTTEPPP